MIDRIDSKSAVPIYRQITDGIRRSVAAGILAPGEKLPSVRDLATRLLVNPNTVAKVYRDLERDGLLDTRRGDGTYVSTGATALTEADRRRLLSDQLRTVARDVRAFGLSQEAALDLFRDVLKDEKTRRKDRT